MIDVNGWILELKPRIQTEWKYFLLFIMNKNWLLI